MAERRVADETQDEPDPLASTLGTTIAALIDSILAIVHRINPHHSDETVTEHVAKLETLKEQAVALDEPASKKSARL